MALDTFENDPLKRGIYADTIINLTRNYDSNLKENQSFVLALDSPWGTGKSTFVKMLCNKIDNSDVNIKTVVYNAWENDYANNAFEPLFYEIIKNEIFDNEVDTNNAEEFCYSIANIAKAFAKDCAKNIGLEHTYDAVTDTGKKTLDLLLQKLQSFRELEDSKKAFEDFRQYLRYTSDWLKDNDNRLLIIIDELDRCKPLFAIQTLEIVKHLFNIPNITFLFSVDFSQLRHSIATVYGQEMDSEGYLRRFVDYILKLPEPSKMDYIDYLLKELPLL